MPVRVTAKKRKWLKNRAYRWMDRKRWSYPGEVLTKCQSKAVREMVRELQRLEDKRLKRRGPSEQTKPWANHLASPHFMADGREFHPERDVPALTPEAEALRTLLTDHGSDAYNKLVRGCKVWPLFGDDK